MQREKAPGDERTRKRVLAEYKKGTKPGALAEKYGISVNTIKSWIRRASVPPVEKPGAEKQGKAGASKRRRGAPVGNTNAVGNSGGAAPVGNTNALLHGGYSPVYWDSLTEEERALLSTQERDPEQLLLEEINLLSIRERRMMWSIQKLRQLDEKTPGGMGQAVAGVVRSENKREFIGRDGQPDYASRDEYDRIQAEKVQNGELLPGHGYTLTTRTEATYDIIHRLEVALTQCQAQKQRQIKTLIELRQIQADSETEIEDLDSLEAEIYGGGQDSGNSAGGKGD